MTYTIQTTLTDTDGETVLLDQLHHADKDTAINAFQNTVEKTHYTIHHMKMKFTTVFLSFTVQLFTPEKIIDETTVKINQPY